MSKTKNKSNSNKNYWHNYSWRHIRTRIGDVQNKIVAAYKNTNYQELHKLQYKLVRTHDAIAKSVIQLYKHQ